MFRILIAALVLTLVLAGFIGCAKSAELKEPMAEGKASVYIYRDAIFGGAPEFNITINDQPLG
ncbi:MAG: hypothetical protein LBU73_06350, partial [Helicobacteraceae bacterium]|nr:hypothetical protein [Helicobacteraceae bacterium]